MSRQDLIRFDKELDKAFKKNDGFSLYSSLSYARLLTARSYRQNLVEELENSEFLGEKIDIIEERSSSVEVSESILNLINREARKLLEDFSYISERTEEGLTSASFFVSYGESIFGYELEKKSQRWALTFDDGPRSHSTVELLRFLSEENIKATFFLVADKVIKYPEVVQKEALEGHLIANHSYSHPLLTKLSQKDLEFQLNESTKIIREYVPSQEVSFFRTPFGAGFRTQRIKKLMKDNKMAHVFWTVDTLDWKDKDPRSIVERTKKQMQLQGDRGIILFHDVHWQTIDAVKILVREKRDVDWLRLDDFYKVY